MTPVQLLTPKACSKGHAMTPENTYVTYRGARECRTCRNEAKRKYRQTPKGKATLKRNLVAWAKRQDGGE